MKKSILALLLLPGAAFAQWSLPDLPAFVEQSPGVFIAQGTLEKGERPCA